MKKLIFTVTLAIVVVSSCVNNGKKTEITGAKKVKINKNEATVRYHKIDSKSHLFWKASHIGGVQPRYGKVSLKKAEALVNENRLTNLVTELNMSSLTVENFKDEKSKKKLTQHLQSNDFFKISTFPTSKFELTAIEEINGMYDSKITGNLTILETTKSITFKAEIKISENEIAIKSEDFVIDRTNWDLTYNTEGTKGVPTDYLISNTIGFTIDVSLNNY